VRSRAARPTPAQLAVHTELAPCRGTIGKVLGWRATRELVVLTSVRRGFLFAAAFLVIERHRLLELFFAAPPAPGGGGGVFPQLTETRLCR